MVNPSSIEFRLADIHRDRERCIAFRRDSFRINYGAEKTFESVMGNGGVDYCERLEAFQKTYPYGIIHVWEGSQIIGQIEFHVDTLFTDKTFIPLFYLIPEKRGSGTGSKMHDYLIHTLRDLGCNGARIPVSSTNERGVAFYKKHGWRYAKPDLSNSNVDIYQLNF